MKKSLTVYLADKINETFPMKSIPDSYLYTIKAFRTSPHRIFTMAFKRTHVYDCLNFQSRVRRRKGFRPSSIPDAVFEKMVEEVFNILADPSPPCRLTPAQAFELTFIPIPPHAKGAISNLRGAIKATKWLDEDPSFSKSYIEKHLERFFSEMQTKREK